VEHISVCICTYKRPDLLRRLLAALKSQESRDLFSYSLVVADNDRLQSAEAIVAEVAASSRIPATYCVEPEQNIALARNRALRHVRGDYVAFIDDDEIPGPKWLLTLYEARRHYGVDGVLGPVKPQFDQPPPPWVMKGGFYDRSTYPTGLVIDWRKGRTGNVLLKRSLFDGLEQAFRPGFLSGEDQDFFRRMIERGHVFVWCDEALAYEVVPPVRWKRSFMLKRALLRGQVALQEPTPVWIALPKSAVAVVVYTLAMPFLLLVGQHVFMKYLVKTSEHLGKLLAFVGFDPVKQKYVTE
jgi:succinoglycan biosynthesis protein ExoM